MAADRTVVDAPPKPEPAIAVHTKPLITENMLNNWFSFHAPHHEDVAKYTAIRDMARQLALVIVANTPPGADQAAAIRKLRECVMTANSAIACGGR